MSPISCPVDLRSRRNSLACLRSSHVEALAADLLSPQADYALDGESVNRESWRAGLWTRIREIDDLLAKLRPPYQFRQRIETI